ncbi:MAG: precorrin-2 C(20)-methyltransferase [candidate division FCPU426 bacterium]
MKLGKFFGVGIGPGDPELLTLKAARVLGSVPVIFVPKAKITDEGMALQTLLKSIVPAKAVELRELVFPMSKDPLILRPAWETAREAILEVLRTGQDCAFITLGDTAIYSTYMNVLAELRAVEPGLVIETVAGISSYSQGAALLNLSLVEKDEGMAILPCLSEVEGMRADLEHFDTVVLMKVGRRFADLRELLRKMDLLKFSHLLLKIGTAEELVSSDLDSVDPTKVTYMSVVIVRKAASGIYS